MGWSAEFPEELLVRPMSRLPASFTSFPSDGGQVCIPLLPIRRPGAAAVSRAEPPRGQAWMSGHFPIAVGPEAVTAS